MTQSMAIDKWLLSLAQSGLSLLTNWRLEHCGLGKKPLHLLYRSTVRLQLRRARPFGAACAFHGIMLTKGFVLLSPTPSEREQLGRQEADAHAGNDQPACRRRCVSSISGHA